jgi:hypothetical protein
MGSFWNVEKWQPIVENVADILRINVCIVNSDGMPIIIPNKNHYGWKFSPYLFAVESNFDNIADGRYELIDRYRFHYYALACGFLRSKPQSYIILGPVILNKRLSKDEYQKIIQQYKDSIDEFGERLDDIRIVSHNHLETILSTLGSLIQIGQENAISMAGPAKVTRSQSVLRSMLGMILAIANAESGSLMLFDGKTNELSIDTVKGLDQGYLNKKVPLDSGISGVAFKENKTFVLTGQSCGSRVHELLNRPEIRESIVMPFQTPDKKTRGVLNVNIMAARSSVRGRLDVIEKTLQQIATKVLQSI